MLNLVKTKVEIGLEKPIKLLHVTDTHISDTDERDDERKRKICERMRQESREAGGDIRENFEDAIAYANGHCDLLAHSGDLISVVSPRSLEVVRECLDKSENHLIIAGNHEFSQYMGEAWEGEAYKMTPFPMVSRILREDLLFSAKQVGGLNVVGIDDSYYRVEPWQLWRPKQEVKKGLPIVLVMHVPVFEERLYELLMEKSKSYASIMGCDEEHLMAFNEFRAVQKRPTDDTLRFIEYIQSEPLIKCILTGHVHFNYECTLPGGIVQLVTQDGWHGGAREVTFC